MQIEFADYAGRVQQHIENVHRIPVVTREIPHTFLGDLNGAEIHIDSSVTSEQRLFLLAHLFGHTVQWNTNPKAFKIATRFNPPLQEAIISQVLDYEQEAAAYGLDLFHRIGIKELDDWFSRYSACDQAYLLHYYRTGTKADFRRFWSNEIVPIQPKPTPSFTPLKREFRHLGVVI